MRTPIWRLLVVAVLSLGLFAPAAQADYTSLSHKYLRLHTKCDKKFGDKACGRNIVKDGVRKRGTAHQSRPAHKWDKADAIKKLRAFLAPPPAISASAPATTQGASSGGASAGLEDIAQCESGGDPTAIGGGGLYRGKYQFDQQTWESVGGSGDPAAASEAEQDRRAAALIAQRGKSPWPNCG